MNGSVIAKVTLLASVTPGLLVQEMRTNAAVVAGPLTTQSNWPVDAVALGTAAAIGSQVPPPSRLTKMFTAETGPRLWLQRICWRVPMRQLVAVLGALTLTEAAPDTIVKLPFEASAAELPELSRA